MRSVQVARESRIEKLLVQEVEKLGGLALKFVSPQRRGVPDRVCVLPNGLTWWVEVKTEQGTLSDLQKYQCRELRARGHNVTVVYGMEEVSLLIEIMKEKLNEQQ